MPHSKSPKSSQKATSKTSSKGNSKATSKANSKATSKATDDTTFDYSEELDSPISVGATLRLEGDPPISGVFKLLVYFNGITATENVWENNKLVEIEDIFLNLQHESDRALLADQPLLFVLRFVSAKSTKELDPLLHPENRAGANVDLYPLLKGQEIFVEVPLISTDTKKPFGCKLTVRAAVIGDLEPISYTPLIVNMLSAHCLPPNKEGTNYVAAVALDGITDPVSIKCGLSLSTPDAHKLVWATSSTGGVIANTQYNVPSMDVFTPDNLNCQTQDKCTSVYWNAMKRILVDPVRLRQRADLPFLIEIAGLPSKAGKNELRGRYIGFLDARVLLESDPPQTGLTANVKLEPYHESKVPAGVGPLLKLPASSAKSSPRGMSQLDVLEDEFGHMPYIVLRFDLTAPLIEKPPIATYYENLGLPTPDIPRLPVDDLIIEATPPTSDLIDAKTIRKEGGALAVHKELCGLACGGKVMMTQGIKRTAASRLTSRMRSVLKHFSPGECSYIEWQDTVTGQHGACRRAVTASFAPQPPLWRVPARYAAARCRISGDSRISDTIIAENLKVDDKNPRILMAAALNYLEKENEYDAKSLLFKALKIHPKNRFLLWLFGGIEHCNGENGALAAWRAFRISVKGNYSDGTANAIGWAALHAVSHHNKKPHAAFVAAKYMRKSFELEKEWLVFLQRWLDISGEEETLWLPSKISSHNPFLIAAAFFLCLRCYEFSERLLKCYEEGCANVGARSYIQNEICVEVYYLRAASLLLRRQFDEAMNLTFASIQNFGPCGIMAQIRAVILMSTRHWNADCETAFLEMEKWGEWNCSALFLRAAYSSLETNPKEALQRATRAHMIAPSGHSALMIARIYGAMNDFRLSELWASAAVDFEPLLADGWAYLAVIAMRNRDMDKIRHFIRTARQVGQVSQDLEESMKTLMDILKVETLSDSLLKNLCFCEYFADDQL